jgi:hypothetical protein
MSATPITWEQWYRTAARTAVQALRAHTERASASAVLSGRTAGHEQWTLTGAGAAAALYGPATPAKAAHSCPWCGRAIRRGEAVTIVGGRPLHNTPCVAQFDAATNASDDGRAR